jgi:hypothetical protein
MKIKIQEVIHILTRFKHSLFLVEWEIVENDSMIDV